MIKEVYEIRDESSDEAFYPLGTFLSQKDAVDALDAQDEKKEKVTERAEEGFEIITVHRRPIGWSNDYGNVVMTRRREEYFDEDSGKYLWKTVDS